MNKKTEKLTKAKLDEIYGNLKKHGKKPARLVVKDMPRFVFATRKLSRAKALARRKKEIEELKEEIAELRRKPLPTTERYYKLAKPGTKEWVSASYELCVDPIPLRVNL